jgi:hypothetical protein
VADTKLSALTELAAKPAVGDELYLRDVSEAAADESKRITVANLISAGEPVFGRVVRTAGNVTTTSTSLVDFTGATVTFTTGAFPAAYGASQSGNNSNTGQALRLNMELDGSTLHHGTSGNSFASNVGGNQINMGFSGQTAALSAASHTILMQWAVTANTGTIIAGSDINHMWWAQEIR